MISVNRRDDRTLKITCKDGDGAAINITGYTVFFTVKRNLNDADANALISKTVTSHTTPAQGITHIPLTKTDTDIEEGDYFFDFQLKDASGNIQSSKADTFNVSQDVTIRTS